MTSVRAAQWIIAIGAWCGLAVLFAYDLPFPVAAGAMLTLAAFFWWYVRRPLPHYAVGNPAHLAMLLFVQTRQHNIDARAFHEWAEWCRLHRRTARIRIEQGKGPVAFDWLRACAEAGGAAEICVVNGLLTVHGWRRTEWRGFGPAEHGA